MRILFVIKRVFFNLLKKKYNDIIYLNLIYLFCKLKEN